jgi:putative aminopeptidase FrvX
MPHQSLKQSSPSTLMASDRFERLKNICQTPGISGFEHPIRALIVNELQGFVDEFSIDDMGNIIAKVAARKKDNTTILKKVMACAHMDEIGFVVSYIEKGGFIRLHPLGGFDVKTLCTQRVLIYGHEPLIGVIGTKPIHIMKDEEKRRVPELEDLYIDTGLSEEEVRQRVKVGDPITRLSPTISLGQLICSKSLDNRISVFVLIETLRSLPELNVDFYAVFSTQEEVGIRGARVAAAQIEPDIGITLDVTLANDVVGINEKDYCTRLGKGVAIKILDSSSISCKELVDFFTQTAIREKIEHQVEILTKGGSDASGLQYLSGKGSISGCLSIPCRNVHSSCELVSIHDVDETIRLLIESLKSIHHFHPTHLYPSVDWSTFY